MPDERVEIPDIVAAARVYALMLLETCGVASQGTYQEMMVGQHDPIFQHIDRYLPDHLEAARRLVRQPSISLQDQGVSRVRRPPPGYAG